MKLTERSTVDPEQCGGRPGIRGVRIRVIDVLDLLASGLTRRKCEKNSQTLSQRTFLRACGSRVGVSIFPWSPRDYLD